LADQIVFAFRVSSWGMCSAAETAQSNRGRLLSGSATDEFDADL